MLVASTAIAVEVMLAGSQSYWIVWSALTLSLIIIGNTFLKRIGAVVGLGVLLAIAAVITNIGAMFMPVFLVVVAIITLACVWLSQRKSEYFYPFVILNLFAVMSGMLPVSIPGSMDRALCILVGTSIASVCQLIFLPGFAKSERDASVCLLIKYLRLLSQDIFACYLQPAYADNVYLFERRIHSQKTRCIRLLADAYSKMGNVSQNKTIIATLENVFESLLACSLLRFRVTDQSVFAVCCSELTEIYDQLDKNLVEMAAVYQHKNPFLNTEGLQEKIELLENNYQTVLQVTAKEPVVFLLFISSLKSLANEIEKFYNVIPA